MRRRVQGGKRVDCYLASCECWTGPQITCGYVLDQGSMFDRMFEAIESASPNPANNSMPMANLPPK